MEQHIPHYYAIKIGDKIGVLEKETNKLILDVVYDEVKFCDRNICARKGDVWETHEVK